MWQNVFNILGWPLQSHYTGNGLASPCVILHIRMPKLIPILKTGLFRPGIKPQPDIGPVLWSASEDKI